MAKKTRPSIEELRKLEERLAASELALRQATAREQALREELTADRERTEAERGDVRIAHESLLAALRSVADSERRSRAIGEPLPFGIWVSDPEGGLIYLSESFLVMMGLSMEDARGFGWMDKVSPGLRERAVADWKRCVETGTFWDQEYIVGGENGKERFVLSWGMPLRDAQGRVIAWAGINLDITESKRAQQVVADAVVYAEAIVETVREPLVVLTADLRVDSANPAFYNAFNVTAEETAHRPIHQLGNGQWNIPRLRELLERVIPGNGRVDDFEVEHEFPTIGRRSMLLNARRIVRQATAEPFILLAIEDITERKRATAKVGHLAAVVESSEDAIFSITLDGVVVSWNVGAQQLYGATSHLTSPLNRTGQHRFVTDSTTIELVRQLAQHYPDDMIARVLIRQGRRSAHGHPFTAARVHSLRQSYGIPAYTGPRPLSQAGRYTIQQAAAQIGVSDSTIRRWLEEGLLMGEQVAPGAPWQIAIDDEVRRRFRPEVPAGWLPMDKAAKALEVSRQTVLHWVKSGRLEAVQVANGKRNGLHIRVEGPGIRLIE